MISATRNMVFGFPTEDNKKQFIGTSIPCPKCGMGNFTRKLGARKFFCINCDTEFDSYCNLNIRSKNKRKEIRGKLEELKLPKLLIKIERLRRKLNAMDMTDGQKLLRLSRKLDKLIAIYQRALFEMEENVI